MNISAEQIAEETQKLLAETDDAIVGDPPEDEAEVEAEADDEPTGDKFDQMDDEAAEAEARVHGWRPEKEFSGPKGRWRDARDFLRKGEEIDVQKSLQREIQDLKSQQSQLISTTSALMKDKEKQYEADKAELLEKLESARAEALEGGDGKEFNKLDKQIRKLESEPESNDPEEVDNAVLKAQREFEQRNDWLADEEMDALAKGLGNKLFATEGQKFSDPTDFFNELELRVKKTAAYKAKFGTPARRPSGVEAGGRGPSGKTAPHTYEGMPKYARDAFVALHEQSNGAITKDDYVKNFWAENPEG